MHGSSDRECPIFGSMSFFFKYIYIYTYIEWSVAIKSCSCIHHLAQLYTPRQAHVLILFFFSVAGACHIYFMDCLGKFVSSQSLGSEGCLDTPQRFWFSDVARKKVVLTHTKGIYLCEETVQDNLVCHWKVYSLVEPALFHIWRIGTREALVMIADDDDVDGVLADDDDVTWSISHIYTYGIEMCKELCIYIYANIYIYISIQHRNICLFAYTYILHICKNDLLEGFPCIITLEQRCGSWALHQDSISTLSGQVFFQLYGIAGAAAEKGHTEWIPLKVLVNLR